MQIELHKIKIRDLIKDYEDNPDTGVIAYNKKLNVRPIYQREFIYAPEKQDAVIDSIIHEFPLNSIYWAVNDDGSYEVLDGQQRILSICRFASGDRAMQDRFFFCNLPDDIQQKILDYELTVYFCTGTNSEKLDWFRIINIAGITLNDQELRNAIYSGTWLTDAKRWFSKPNAPAHNLAGKYLNKKKADRQEYLEVALKWISDNHIEEYMSQHQHDANANELWLYFKAVIDWVSCTFPDYHADMRTVDWHKLYKAFHNKVLDIQDITAEIKRLRTDPEVTNTKGIYSYVLTRNEQDLMLREFDPVIKKEVYNEQQGICPHCHKHFEYEEMHGDHITPWSRGGKTVKENCQMLCSECNRRKWAN